MGRYIEVPEDLGKAAQILAGQALWRDGEQWRQAPPYAARLSCKPLALEDVPAGMALIAIAGMGRYEAAAWCFCQHELDELARCHKSVTWVQMDLATVRLCTG